MRRLIQLKRGHLRMIHPLSFYDRSISFPPVEETVLQEMV